MKKDALEEFLEKREPKLSIRREDLEKLSDDELDRLIKEKYGFLRTENNKDRAQQIESIFQYEKFIQITYPPILREELEKLSNEELDRLMMIMYGFPRFGTWGDFIKDRNKKMEFIITGDIGKFSPRPSVPDG